MGTRHLIAVSVDGQYKLAQYGQWDGHPGGQGIDVLNFLRGADLKALAAKARAARFADNEEISELWVECGALPGATSVCMDISARFAKRYPQMSRDCGAEALSILAQAADGMAFKNSINFAADSLFCEWGYVIDLDKGTFEVYKGFNEEPLPNTERFAHLARADEKYAPIKLAKSYALAELPEHEAFLADFRDPDEDE